VVVVAAAAVQQPQVLAQHPQELAQHH